MALRPGKCPSRTEKSRTRSTARNQTTFSEYLESLLVTVILALFGTSFVVQAFKIPSQSMERTLLVGDHLAGEQVHFWRAGRVVRQISAVPGTGARGHHCLQISLPGPSALCETRDRIAGGSPENSGPTGVHQREAAERAVCGARSGDRLYGSAELLFPPVGNQIYLSQVQPEWAHEIHKYIQGDEIVVPPGKYFAMGTIGIIAWTAATGDSWIATPSWGGRS